MSEQGQHNCIIKMVSGGLDTSDVKDKSALKNLAKHETKGIQQNRPCCPGCGSDDNETFEVMKCNCCKQVFKKEN